MLRTNWAWTGLSQPFKSHNFSFLLSLNFYSLNLQSQIFSMDCWRRNQEGKILLLSDCWLGRAVGMMIFNVATGMLGCVPDLCWSSSHATGDWGGGGLRCWKTGRNGRDAHADTIIHTDIPAHVWRLTYVHADNFWCRGGARVQNHRSFCRLTSNAN